MKGKRAKTETEPQRPYRLTQVITTGQDGVAFAALRAARDTGIATSGWMPRGYQTQSGPNPARATEFDLEEDPSEDPKAALIENIKYSDAVLILGTDLSTLKASRKIAEDMPRLTKSFDLHTHPEPEEIVAWVTERDPPPQILCVVGNTPKVYHYIEATAYDLLVKAFDILQARSPRRVPCTIDRQFNETPLFEHPFGYTYQYNGRMEIMMLPLAGTSENGIQEAHQSVARARRNHPEWDKVELFDLNRSTLRYGDYK